MNYHVYYNPELNVVEIFDGEPEVEPAGTFFVGSLTTNYPTTSSLFKTWLTARMLTLDLPHEGLNFLDYTV